MVKSDSKGKEQLGQGDFLVVGILLAVLALALYEILKFNYETYSLTKLPEPWADALAAILTVLMLWSFWGMFKRWRKRDQTKGDTHSDQT